MKGLADSDSQGIVFPVLLLDGNKELLDTLKGQLITLDKHSDGVGHEFGGHVENVVR